MLRGLRQAYTLKLEEQKTEADWAFTFGADYYLGRPDLHTTPWVLFSS
jgi:hypothetical protein